MSTKIRSIEIYNRKSTPNTMTVGGLIKENIVISKIDEILVGNSIVYDVYVTTNTENQLLYKR